MPMILNLQALGNTPLSTSPPHHLCSTPFRRRVSWLASRGAGFSGGDSLHVVFMSTDCVPLEMGWQETHYLWASCPEHLMWLPWEINIAVQIASGSSLKQQYLKGKDTSKVSRLQRKLIFDTTTEILDRNRQLPPWKTALPATGQDMLGFICGVLKKDLSAGDEATSSADCPMQKSEALLDMERMIFKDLIGETIQDLAELACRSSGSLSSQKPWRKLVF